MVHRPAETQLNFHTETIAVRNAKGFGLLESSGDDCIGAVTLSVDNTTTTSFHSLGRSGLIPLIFDA